MCCDALGRYSLETVDVKHRTRAYRVIVTSREGLRVVRAGFFRLRSLLLLIDYGHGVDTRETQCRAQVSLKQGMAHHKAHSTVSQAVSVGRQCVFSTLLSSFLFAHHLNGGTGAG